MKRNFMVSLFGSFVGLGLLFILFDTPAVQAPDVVTNCTRSAGRLLKADHRLALLRGRSAAHH